MSSLVVVALTPALLMVVPTGPGAFSKRGEAKEWDDKQNPFGTKNCGRSGDFPLRIGIWLLPDRPGIPCDFVERIGSLALEDVPILSRVTVVLTTLLGFLVNTGFSEDLLSVTGDGGIASTDGGDAGIVTPPLSIMSKLSSSPDQYFLTVGACGEPVDEIGDELRFSSVASSESVHAIFYEINFNRLSS